MDIFQKSITPDKPRVLAEEQIYVYVPMATSTNAGIASYNRDQFDVIGSEVSLKWPAESFVQGPIETPSIVKVLDNEFEYTGNLVDLISGNNKISSDKLEVQLKRILRDAYERPELVMLDPNYFVRTIVEKDGKQYYKYNTTAVHYNMSQNLSEYEQAQARQNISASSVSDNEATNKRIDALLQTGVYTVNGKTGNVILTTSDIENNSDYTTNSYVNEQVNTLNTNKADLDYVNEQLQLINSDKAVTDEFKNNLSIQFAESERQKSKNLFNKDAVLKNHEINGNNGTIVASTDYWVSDYIRVVGMSSVYISSTKTSGSSNVFYDNNYNILSISSKTNGVLSIPSNAIYMRCNGLMSELENNIQIEEGSVATEYQPYNGQITHNGDAPVVFAEREKNRTINLFNYKTQAGTSDVTNNQDGSFTISNLTFYYPSLILNIALKPNTKYTFAETVLEVSDSVGLEASNVAFGVVAYYTDGTYSSTPEIPIRGTGRYSGTFTTNNKTIDYIECRILRKNNGTSILNGKVTDISVCEGDNTIYYPYEGLIVHEEQLKDYLPLSGGTMTGQLKLASDGLITNANDGYSTDKRGNLNALSSDAGALFKINSYDKSKSLTYAWNTGLLTLPSIPKVNDVNVALLSDLNSYLPLSGGTMTGAILFSDNATYSSTTQPTALSYGRLQAYGTLNINGNTDNSGTEYVNITAGHGCSSSTADGLSIGTDTLTWKNQDVVHSGNIGTYGVEGKTSDYISNKYLRFCQLQTNVGSGFSFATFLITAGGDVGGKFIGTYLVTIGTRGGTDGSIKVLCLQKPSSPSSFKFGYRVNPDDSNRVDYFMHGAIYNFYPIKVICLTKGGGYQVNTDLVEIAEPSSYTTASYNGDIECGSINLIV